jgi:hypothetical protein
MPSPDPSKSNFNSCSNKNTQTKGTKMEGLTYCTTTPKDMQSKIEVENGKQNDKYKVENIMA